MSAERDAGFAALQQGDVATAISTLETARQRDTNDYQTLLYLGAAYGQAERHTDAVTTLTEAVHLQPSNAQARYNLGVSYERAGWKEEALTAMGQALQLQPNYPQAQEALNRLQPMASPAPVAEAPQPGYAPPTQQMPAYGANPSQGVSQAASPYGASPQSPAPYGAPPQNYQPAPYGQPAPPYGSQPQSPGAYGAPQYPQQMPNPGAQNTPYGNTPQSYQAYHAPPVKEGSIMTGALLSVGLVLLCGIGVGYFTLVTGMRFPFLALVFGFLFGWFVPKVCGGHGQAQAYIAGAGAGIASLAAIGVAYALGAYISPLSFLFALIAINRGYTIAGGGD